MKVQASTAPRTSRLTGRAEDLRPRDVTTATTPAVGAAAGRRPQTAGTGGPACRRGSPSPGSRQGKVLADLGDPHERRAGDQQHGDRVPGDDRERGYRLLAVRLRVRHGVLRWLRVLL